MKNIALLLMLAGAFSVSAQHPICGFDHLVNSPENSEKRVMWNEAYRQALDHSHESRSSVVYEIPVVFHVVWNQAEQNLPDSVIFSQMEVLNEDYRRQNPDADQTRDEFLPVAADAEIEFVLADVDPDGNPTDGIDRVESDVSGFSLGLLDFSGLDEVKNSTTGGADAWDPDHYLNIWVCNIEAGFFGQVFGYAYPPDGLDNWPAGSSAPQPGLEGVVLFYPTVGRNNPQGMDDDFAGNEGGRTATHEVGHYLGLRHIWGDAFFLGCNEDDGIEDTPNAANAANFLCDFSANTCDDGDGDLPDMIENYMDYNQDECLNVFTQQQVDLMRYVLENYRPELVGLSVGVESDEVVKFNIYPNPTNEILNVRMERRIAVCNMDVLDASGRIIQSVAASSPSVQIDVKDLDPGVYFISSVGVSQRFVKL